MKKIAVDMLKNPQVRDVDEMPEIAGDSAFDKALEILKVLSGPELEIMTRTTPRLVDMVNVAYNLVSNFHSPYIAGRADQCMRLAVSMRGEGRREIVDSLKAGASAVAMQAMERSGNLSYYELPED